MAGERPPPLAGHLIADHLATRDGGLVARPTLVTVQGMYLMLDGTHDNTSTQFTAAIG